MKSLIFAFALRSSCRYPDAAGTDRASSSKALREKRRYFIVVAFIIAAVLTPPESQSRPLAIPLLRLYEGSIIAGAC